MHNMQNTKPELPNQTYQAEPTTPNLPNQTYQIYKTKPTKPNQTYQTKFNGQSSQRLGPQCLWQCLSFRSHSKINNFVCMNFHCIPQINIILSVLRLFVNSRTTLKFRGLRDPNWTISRRLYSYLLVGETTCCKTPHFQ